LLRNFRALHARHSPLLLFPDCCIQYRDRLQE
jgi:hypothetical protein